jgi:uncharacterized lipoprotein YddW (UPF0748 family)
VISIRGILSGLLLLLSLIQFAAGAEFRGAWVASVYNLNFPSHAGLSAFEQKEQIRRLVDAAANAGLNALMIQVRPEGDALYESDLEPWSRFLTGTQGASPGYDPLATFIEEGKRHDIAIHAWINPYRAVANASNACASSHEIYQLRNAVRRVSSSLWMDPGDAAVRQHVARVIKDLVSRYSVAGIVLDDYFYPYPSRGHPRGTFPDGTTYARYRASGGKLGVDDWRRHNVDLLIENLHAVVKEARPHALFGVSPFGIYTVGAPPGVHVELDQYRDLYADPVKWMKEGWVDYLSPQLYWRDGSAQSYSALLQWWRSSDANPHEVPIFPSIALERLGSGYGWPASEIAHQLSLERSIKPRSEGGFILWNIGPLSANQKGIAKVIAAAR